MTFSVTINYIVKSATNHTIFRNILCDYSRRRYKTPIAYFAISYEFGTVTNKDIITYYWTLFLVSVTSY